jgi:acyl carrier protein
MDTLENDLKKLIVEALKLEDVSPDDIGDDEALFGDSGLGLDSIDALELGVAIRKTFGIKIDTVTEEVRHHFASIRNLANFIRAQQGNAA